MHLPQMITRGCNYTAHDGVCPPVKNTSWTLLDFLDHVDRGGVFFCGGCTYSPAIVRPSVVAAGGGEAVHGASLHGVYLWSCDFGFAVLRGGG